MGDAPATAILWPAVAMAGQTLLAWGRRCRRHLGDVARKCIEARHLAGIAGPERLLVDTRASDNVRNLFALPVLSYTDVPLPASA